jgi:hypothetical protein
MAQEESDREDLLREATALVQRVELAPVVAAPGEHVVAGFRAGGALSIYFGSDPAYHFNSRGQLRRAFCGGRLFKAEAGRLVSLDRYRQAHEVQLVRHKLGPGEQTEFLANMSRRLQAFTEAFATGGFNLVGQVPADVDVAGLVIPFLGRYPNAIVAQSSHAQ